MARTRLSLILLVLAAASAPLLSGCFNVEANLAVRVDGSTDIEMKMAVSEELMAMSPQGEDPFAEAAGEMAKSGWALQPMNEDGWKGVSAKRTSPPGAPLFPVMGDNPAPDLKITTEKRVFSTDYVVKGKMQMGGGKDEPAKEPAEARAGSIVFTQLGEEAPGPGFDEQALMGLLAGGMKGAGIGISVACPGTVVETNGTVDEDGVARWRMDIGSLMGQAEQTELDVYVHSRLLNQQNIGRLADKLAASSQLYDMSALIAEYVERGLLPNPVREDPLTASLDTTAYDNAISIIVCLEETLGAPVAQRVVQALGLNADDVTAKQLRQTWELLRDMDEDELIGAAAHAVHKHVEMRQE